MQKLSVWLGIPAIAFAVIMEIVVFYKGTQETIINKNKIREGHATAESAEAVAKINANNIAKSVAEARKLKADADNAELLARINKNSVAKSVSEARKVKAEAENAEYLATINQYGIEISKADAAAAAIGAEWSEELNRCNDDPRGVASCLADKALRELHR